MVLKCSRSYGCCTQMRGPLGGGIRCWLSTAMQHCTITLHSTVQLQLASA